MEPLDDTKVLALHQLADAGFCQAFLTMMLEEVPCQQIDAAVSYVPAKYLIPAFHHLKCLLTTTLGVLCLCTDTLGTCVGLV